MERVISSLLIAAGLVNFAPVAGVLSAAVLVEAYGIATPEGDLLVLMRHRALLFGIVGAIIIASAFRRHLQPTAIAAGLGSMLGFIALTLAASESGAELQRIVLIDAAASVALVAVLVLRFRRAPEA